MRSTSRAYQSPVRNSCGWLHGSQKVFAPSGCFSAFLAQPHQNSCQQFPKWDTHQAQAEATAESPEPEFLGFLFV
jgi:hypothetical protein